MHAWNPIPHTRSLLRRRAGEERGQALVEFALVLPVLILIIVGIIYFGRYMSYSNQETQLAEQGARWAAVNFNPPGSATLQSYIHDQAQPELQNGSSDVTSPLVVYIYYPTGNPTPYNTVGNSLRVCVVATVKYPLLGIATTSSTMAQSATMRIEAVSDSNSFTADTTSSVPAQCPKT